MIIKESQDNWSCLFADKVADAKPCQETGTLDWRSGLENLRQKHQSRITSPCKKKQDDENDVEAKKVKAFLEKTFLLEASGCVEDLINTGSCDSIKALIPKLESIDPVSAYQISCILEEKNKKVPAKKGFA